jgi:hypothetical protein
MEQERKTFIMTPKALGVIQDIEKYLFFTMKIGDKVLVSKLAKEANREAFVSFIEYFALYNRGYLGGFQIAFTDKSKTEIEKRPAIFMSANPTVDGYYVCDLERYSFNRFQIDKIKNCLTYGD